jgi:large subunit ribosomal protein L17
MGYRKLGLRSDQRKAMLRNMVTSLIKEERITTTETRAKEVRSITEKMVTLAKRGDLAARRQVMEYVFDKAAVRKLFDTVGPRYEDRSGGYTRIIRIGHRQGDAAPMVILELV